MDDVERVQPHSESKVAAIADKQFGVFSRQQALDLGFTARKIQLRVEAGRWDVPLRGVYRIVGSPKTLHQSAMAAALYVGEGAVVSHGTAGLLWEIPSARSSSVELWVSSAKRSVIDGLVLHRGTRVDRADRSMLGPIPVTSAARTLIDLSARMEDDRLLTAMEDAFRRGIVTPERLLARVRALRNSGRPGTGRLAALLEDRTGSALESQLEAKVWLLVQRTGLPLPTRQHWVSLPGGRYRLDFAWPDRRVALECDGWEHHGRRSAFARDRARLAEFAAARWHVLPVTWHAVSKEPARVERWLHDSLNQNSLVT